jgi:hypothetical protein
MDRLQQEVALKNQYIDALNNNSNNAYAYQSGLPTDDGRKIAQEKSDNTAPSPVPEPMTKDEQAEKKQTWKTIGIVVGILALAYALWKFKIIKI